MRVVLCAIAKNEHLYINEWVKHYIDLGIDHIYLYDNDDKSSKYVGSFISSKYADKITIINIRGIKRHFLQHQVYNVFYNHNSMFFDWVLFCDIDEFLMGIDNVKDFLSQDFFKNFEQIRVKWKLFGDDDVVKRDLSIGVKEFFKIEKPNTRVSNQGKSFIRGHKEYQINSCHYVKGLKSCYPSGKQCSSIDFELNDYDNETIYMNHYMTKTLDEFIKQKLGRGDAVWETRTISLEYFWKINDITQEKLDYLKSIGLEN